jgi:hypothetical protein
MVNKYARDEEKLRMFKPRPLFGKNTRCETSRVIMADAVDHPGKSIFNIGQ